MQLQDSVPAEKNGVFPPTLDEEKGQQRWRRTVDPWWHAMLTTLPVFLLTRLTFLLLTYFGVVLFTVPNYSFEALSGNALFYSWYRWDAVRFVTIAANGYVSLEYAAFFPLYPLLENIVSAPFHHNFFMAGMVISNLAFIGVLVVLYRFVETEFDRDTAKRTTLYLAIFPTTFFFFTAYNESLFLLFMLLSYYSMRRSLWWLAGLFGCLATLTRSAGLVLLVVFLYEFVRQSFPRREQLRQDRQHRYMLSRYIPRKLSGLFAVLLIPLGLGIYSFYLNLRFQNPLAFLHAQAHWRLGLSPPWYALLSTVKNLTTFSPYGFVVTHDIIDLLAFLCFFTLLIFCFVGTERFAKDQWSLPLFGLLILLYPLLFPGLYYLPLVSMQRFVLELPAGFIMLARLGKRPAFHQAYVILTLPLLGFLLLQFVLGRWTV